MKLKELLQGLTVLEATADLETDISHVSYDSRQTRPGDLFVAMPGFAVDGHDFIGKAMEAGAAAVLCEKAPERAVPYVRVAASRRALAVVGANFYGHPADETMRRLAEHGCAIYRTDMQGSIYLSLNRGD